MVDVLEIRDGVELRSQWLKLRVQSWGENSLRVRATVLSDIDDSLDWALLEPKEAMVKVNINDGLVSVENGHSYASSRGCWGSGKSCGRISSTR